MDSLSTVSARIFAQYSNAAVQYPLTAAPSELATRLSQVAPHTRLHYANANRTYALVDVPTELGSLLGQIGRRVVYHYADASLAKPLAYPQGLVNDNQPPVLTTPISPMQSSGTTIIIVIVTDEFTRYTIVYNLTRNKSGAVSETASLSETAPIAAMQTQTASDYAKTHTITLENLTAEATYSYEITLEDCSNNQQQLNGSFTVEAEVADYPIYLPIVVR